MSRLVEPLGGSNVRETTGPNVGPVTETDKARFEMIGPFVALNAGAAQAATAMPLAGVAGVLDIPAPRAGKVIGLSVRSNADLTAGTSTFTAKVGSTAAGTAVLSDTVQSKISTFAAPLAFAAGDLLSVTQATDAGYLPVTADSQAWLLIEWSPLDG
jgi:hypothetical protein